MLKMTEMNMSYDRYIEGMPCMRKRVRNHGNGKW